LEEREIVSEEERYEEGEIEEEENEGDQMVLCRSVSFVPYADTDINSSSDTIFKPDISIEEDITR
jgi:hypothetical protein